MKRTLILLLVAFAAQGLLAQAAPKGQPANPNETPTPPSAEATAKINEILEGEEAVLEGLVSSYDPGSRRDPFRSLLAPAPGPALRGPRPEGIAGMLIDEIDVRGIFKTSKGYVAQVAVQNQRKNFMLREGDQLYDGDVLRIGLHEIVFRQIVNDPTVIKPFREVVKKLFP